MSSAPVDFSDLGAVPVGQPDDFSDLGAKAVEQPKASPNPNIDMSTVAGATPGTPSPAQVAKQPTADRPVGKITGFQAATHLADMPRSSAEEEGVTAAIGQALTGGNREHPIEGFLRQQDPILASLPVGAYETGAGVKDAAVGIANRDPNAAARGGTRALSGAMEAGTIPMGTGIAQAPLRMGVGYLEAIAAGKSAEYAAKKMGLSPDEQEFANTVGTFLPMAYHTAKANTTLINERDLSQHVPGAPEGTTAKGVQMGPAGAMVTETPAGQKVLRTKVGPFTKNVTLSEGRQLPPAPVDPAAQVAREQAQTAASAMADHDALDQAAKNMANGVQPPQPGEEGSGKAPLPAGMERGQVTPQTVQNVGKAIAMAPPEARGQMIQEAHQNLAAWMAQQGKVQGPDGQITVLKNPEQAQQLAAKWINDEVGQQQKAQEGAAKAAEKAANDTQKAHAKAQKEAQKQSDQQQKEREKAGEPTIEQRAKTLLDTYPERNPVAVLQRNLGLNFSDAQGLADRVRQNAPIEAAPKVGGEGHEVIEEARATVDKQVEALQAGTIKAVHIPEGSTYTPKIPDGMKAIDIKNGPGAGRFIYDPQQIRAATIKEAARAGTHGDLLGHVSTKQQVAQSENPVIVQARDHDGTVIQDSAVDGGNPGAVQAQTESLHERHPDAHISVVQPHEALNERIEAKNEEEPPKDFADLGAVPVEEQKSVTENQSHPATEVKPAEPAKPAAPEAAGSGPATPEVAKGEIGPEAKKDPWRVREEKIKQAVKTSKAAGNPHVDQLPYGVETMRGVHFRSLRDGTGGTITTVGTDNLVRYQQDDGKDDIVGRRETEEWVVDGRRNVKLNQKTREYQVTGPIPKAPHGVTGFPLPTAHTEEETPAKGADITKGARVTFTDRSGKERTGTVAHTDGRIVRVKADDDRKSYSVATGKVKPFTEPEKSLSDQGVEATMEASRKQGDQRPEPEQRTNAENDVANNQGQKDAAVGYLREHHPQMVDELLAQNPDVRAVLERVIEKEASKENSGNANPEGHSGTPGANAAAESSGSGVGAQVPEEVGRGETEAPASESALHGASPGERTESGIEHQPAERNPVSEAFRAGQRVIISGEGFQDARGNAVADDEGAIKRFTPASENHGFNSAVIEHPDGTETRLSWAEGSEPPMRAAEAPRAAPEVQKAPERPTLTGTDKQKRAVQSEIANLKIKRADLQEKYNKTPDGHFSPAGDAIRREIGDLTKQLLAKEDELATLSGQPTRAEKKAMQEAAASKPFDQRPDQAMTYSQPEQSQHWQVTEPDYVRKRFEQEAAQYDRGIEQQKAEVKKLKPGTKAHDTAASTLAWYEATLKRLRSGDEKAADKYKREYADLVKKAISKGSPVPEKVIQQYSEFRTAQTARERYEKGRHTSFANRSIAVNDTMQKAEGFKVKRQDGKEITPKQIEELKGGIDDIASVLGADLHDMMRGTDLTIAHTNGKHPFLSDAGGMYHPGEKSISAGINNWLGQPVRALAHEVGHWFDYESGKVMGAETQIVRSGGKRTGTHYASEADAAKSRYAGYGGRAESMYGLALKTMTDTIEVKRMLKVTKLSDLDPERRSEVERTKVVLGHYWREPREIFARLFEQYISEKLGRGGLASETPDLYHKTPGWWDKEAWAKLEPMIEAEVNKRLTAMRERYAPKASEATPVATSAPAAEPKPAAKPKDWISTVKAKKEPAEAPRAITGQDGKSTTLLTPSRELPATYRLVEADDLQPSHNAHTFAKNPAYPEGLQERAYDTSKEAQNRVIQQAQNYDPRYTVNTNPDAVNGPPVITPTGIVLGGNSRAMSTQRLYAKGGDAYRAALKESAATYGFTPEQVDAMKKPVLVRQVENPSTPDDARRLGSELNKSMTGAMGVAERAVSAGKNIKADTLRNVAAMMQADDSTLREAMGKHGSEIVKMLTADGVITERERPQFVDAATGGLSEEGKTFVERALMGTVIDDPRLMDAAPKSVLQKLERSLGSITSFASRADEWNLLPAIRTAVGELGAIQRAGTTVDLRLGQTSLFGGERNPLADALVRALDGKPTAVRKAFDDFARDADANLPGQARMFGNADAFDAFNHAFGSTLTAQEFYDGLDRSAATEPRSIEEAHAGGTAGLFEPRASDESAGGRGSTSQSPTGSARELEANPTPLNNEPEYLSGGLGAVIPSGALAKAAKPVLEFLGVPEEYAKVRASRDLQDGLYTLESRANADVLRAKDLMKDAPGTATDSAIVYHHIEDPTVPLNAVQRELLDEYVSPLMRATEAKVKLMREDGATIENYVHRIVKGKGNFIDRLLAGSKSTGKGNVLRKTVPSEKSRTMMALQPDAGSRTVVSIKGDRVTAFRSNGTKEDLGPLSSGLTTRLEQLDQRLEPVVRDILKARQDIKDAEQRDREDYTAKLQDDVDQMKRDRDLIGTIKGRVPGQQSAHGVEVSFRKRASLTEKIDKAERELEAYKEGRAEIRLSTRASERIRRLKETISTLEAQRNRLLEQVPTERMADKVWLDKNGKRWKITQATTKEIENVTDLEYYHNALGSAVINWLAVEKQFRALQFLKAFTENPDFARVGMKMEDGKPAPEGWKTTELPQLRGYHFEPHIAEVLDWYNDRLKSREPRIFEKINDFLVSSIFFNPLLHVPNILNHWAVEKGVSGWVDPTIKISQAKAIMKAINAVIHQNDDFLAALDAGAPLQSQRFGTHEYAKIFLEKMQEQMEATPTAWERTAKLLGYANPLKLLDALKTVSGRVTWYSNDIAFLQAAYEKTANGMDLKTALRETAKHIPDYRMPTRIFDSAALQKVLSNRNLVMFMHYHYGALKSYGETLKSLGNIGWTPEHEDAKGEDANQAGRTRDQEKLHGMDILAMLGLVTLAVYPAIDALLRKMTGNKDATLRRAGASTLPYNLMQMAHGEKSPSDVLQSVITPGVTAKALTELATNRDLRTGREIYNYPVHDWETFMQQAGGRLAQSFGPANEYLKASRQGFEKQALGMVGVSFPQHGAMRIASEIATSKADRHALAPAEAKQMRARYQALDALRAGDDVAAQKLMQEAGLTHRQRVNLKKEVRENPLVAKVHNFTGEELQQVYDHATAEEKTQLGPLLRHKQREERKHSLASR